MHLTHNEHDDDDDDDDIQRTTYMFENQYSFIFLRIFSNPSGFIKFFLRSI